ncbi:MAG TPA: hypothetical protein VGF38_24415 [Ktedonobacterales bacterium]|jgi:hypothetical protein
MATYVQTPVETGETNHKAEHVIVETAQELGQATMTRRRPRRGALVFVSGFMLGAVATTAASLLRRGRMPFVLGNRNVLVSLPFSGITFSAPSVRSKGRGRGRGMRSNGLAAFYGMSRGKKRGR